MKYPFKSLILPLLLCVSSFGQGSEGGGGGTSGGQAGTMVPGNVNLVSIQVIPGNQSQNVGQTLGFRALGTLSSGPVIDLTKYITTWASSNIGIANPIVQQPSDTTQNISCVNPGTVQISATYLGVTGTTSFTCVAVLPPVPTPVSLAISPTSPTIPQGQAGGVQYTATETYSDGSTQPVTAAANWSSSDSTKVLKVGLSSGTPATEEFDCVGTGSATVSATNDGLSAATTTQTCSAILSSISVTPASPSVVAGNTFQFIATCTFTDGSSQPCASPTWSSNTTATATITQTGLATAVAAGTSTIKAKLGSIFGTTVLTVTAPGPPPPTLSSLTVTPSAKTVNVGSSLTVTATGNYSDGSNQNVSPASTWASSNTAIASLQLADAVVGKAYSQTLGGTGSTPYIWTVPALASSGQVDLLDWACMPLPTRNSFHLSGNAVKYCQIGAGLLWWLKGSGGFPADLLAYDGQNIYDWGTENGDGGSQDTACQTPNNYPGTGPFSSCFTDPYAFKRFVTPLSAMPRYFTLGGPDVTLQHPSPNNFVRTTNCQIDNQPLINLGNVVEVTHDGDYFAGGTTRAFGGSVGTAHTIERLHFWGLSSVSSPYQSGHVEVFDLVSGFGQVEWRSYHWGGSSYLLDQDSLNNNQVAGGSPTPNYGCRVPILPLAGILPPGTLSTASAELDLGVSSGTISGTPNTPGTYNFIVQQEDAGGAFHITPQTIIVNATAATATQTVKCVAPGTITITATDGSVSNNTSVTCQNPTPTLSSIAVSPVSPVQFNGSSVQFTATGTYSDGSTQPLTSTAVWTSGTQAVATISSNVAKCIANSGTSVITATVGAVSGNQTLTCTAPTTGTSGNSYCTTGGTWIGPTVDGPASLPTACMNTALSNTPSPGTTRGPDSLTSTVQADINASACGDTVLVTAGSTLGTLTFPAKGCDSAHWITIKSTGTTNVNFPAEGTRMTPCWSGVASMPNRPAYTCPSPTVLTFKIVAPIAGNAIIDNGDHYRIIGAQITRNQAHGLVFFLVDLPGAAPPFPNNLILDRVWMDGVEGSAANGNAFPQTTANSTETQRAISLRQSNHVALIDSYVSNMYCESAISGCDSQAIGGGFGPTANSGWGVYKAVNNHLEAAAEGILLGGSGGPPLTPSGCTVLVNCNLDVPTDIEVRQNYFFKPPQWNGNTTTPGGTGWPVEKNGFEMKTGARAFFEGNVIENTWYQAQVGYAWSTAPKNQSAGAAPNAHGACPTCLTNDFTYRYNYAYNVAYGIGLYQSKDSGCGGTPTCDAQGANRVSIHDNIIGDNLNMGSLSQQNAGDEMEVFVATDSTGLGLDQINNVNISHNTFVKGIRAITIFGGAPSEMHSWTVQNNIWNGANFGFMSFGAICDQGPGITNNAFAILNACVSPYTWNFNGVFAWNTANNGIVGSKWPTDGKGTGNFFYSNSTGPLFVNYGTGNSNFNPGNYALQTASPWHNAGSDGKDLGADTVTLLQKIAGVRQ